MRRRVVTLRLATTAAFLGILAAFLMWSVQWSLDDRRQITFDMPGSVATLTVAASQQEVSAVDASAASTQLRRYLTDRGLSLVVASRGDGAPQMIVVDPARRLSWLTPNVNPSGSVTGVYLFEGSYSSERWASSSVTPLLPEGTTVAGVLAPPSGVGDLQYVRPIDDVFPAGEYVLGQATSAEFAQILDLLRAQGLEAQGGRQIPLIEFLAGDPLVVVTALFLGMGLVCAATYWSLLVGQRTPELGIRRRHGARLATLIGRWFASGLPSIALGLVVGVSISGVVVRVVGREALDGGQYLTLVQAAGLGLAVTSAAWCATVAMVLRARDEVRRAA